MDPEPRPSRAGISFAFGLLVVVSLLWASAIGFHERGQVNFSSDQAVPALMALEIRDHGSHPVFYWGVQYDGSLEPHLLSLVFRLLPDTVRTYRLVMLGLMTLSTILIAIAGARAFGPWAGLLAGGYLATGPSFLYFKLLGSDGAYTSFFTLTAAAVLIAVFFVLESAPLRARALAFSLGLVLGVAWWVTPLSIVLACIPLAGWIVAPRAWLRVDRLVLTIAGLLLGASPWLTENLRTGFASLRSSEMGVADLHLAATQLRTLVARGLPVLLGGRSPGSRVPTFPGSEALSVVIFGALVAAGIYFSRRRRDPEGRFLALVSTFLLVVPGVLALSRARTDFREDPRFLISSYVGVAVIAGLVVAHLIERGFRWRAIGLGLLVALLGIVSQLRSPRYGDDPKHGRIAETEALARRLSLSGIRHIYAEYWIAYRLSFFSRGWLVASPFGEGTPGPIRDIRAYEQVESSPAPAFLLDAAHAARLRGFLDSRSLGYRHEVLPEIERELIWEIPAAELAAMRACDCLTPAGEPPPKARPSTEP